MKTTYSSPSNIALVKYWGKRGHQLPANASLSFTLSKAKTTTSVELREKSQAKPTLIFLFEGKENRAFANRIDKYLESIQGELAFLKDFDLVIESSNTFPHSSGIASSASAMSALAMCLVDIQLRREGKAWSEAALQFASHLSRLGSGSACRSIYPRLVEWGRIEAIQASSDLHAIGLGDEMHPDFENYQDTILIVSAEQKEVSSSLGHQLMNEHIYADRRFEVANQNVLSTMEALRTGDFEQFVKLVEFEALNLHGLMMMSDPSFVLMKPNTLRIIEKIRRFRRDTAVPIAFTLDAGPNVHLLYPKNHLDVVRTFIGTELLPYCDTMPPIYDQLGLGSEKISE